MNLFVAFDTRRSRVYGRTHRFVSHHPPVHRSWMDQVGRWFSILRRKRPRISDFANEAALAERLQAEIRDWNEVAHPFNWGTRSGAKIMAKCQLSEAPSERNRAVAA